MVTRVIIFWVLGIALSVAVILNIFNVIQVNNQFKQVNVAISDLNVKSTTLKNVDEQLARTS